MRPKRDSSEARAVQMDRYGAIDAPGAGKAVFTVAKQP